MKIYLDICCYFFLFAFIILGGLLMILFLLTLLKNAFNELRGGK